MRPPAQRQGLGQPGEADGRRVPGTQGKLNHGSIVKLMCHLNKCTFFMLNKNLLVLDVKIHRKFNVFFYDSIKAKIPYKSYHRYENLSSLETFPVKKIAMQVLRGAIDT